MACKRGQRMHVWREFEASMSSALGILQHWQAAGNTELVCVEERTRSDAWAGRMLDERVLTSGECAENCSSTQGPGLCHGVSGNGYALLSAYQHTRDMQYLVRAVRFATWLTEHWQQLYGHADRPLSLFEVKLHDWTCLHPLPVLVSESCNRVGEDCTCTRRRGCKQLRWTQIATTEHVNLQHSCEAVLMHCRA